MASVTYFIFSGATLIQGVLSIGSRGVAYTTVGRWMSKNELEAMNLTKREQEGAGGQTFVSIGGANSYNSAAKGSVYVEFDVPTRSLGSASN